MRSLAVAGALAAALVQLPAALAADEPAAPPPQAAPAAPSAPAAAPAGPPPPAAAPAPAGTAQDAEARKKLEEQIAKELGSSPQAGGASESASAGSGARGGAAAAGAGQPAAGGNPLARLLLLPDISAIGSFALAHDTYDVAALSPRTGPYGPPGEPHPLLQEVELALQSVVDPYARADMFVSFAPEGVEVEEAYATTLSLPAGFQVRAGKFFSPFGRQNQQHPHVWDFVDAPLAHGRLISSDVLSGAGVDVAWLAPLPWFAELHLAGQATAPTPEDADRLTGVTRLLQYFSLDDATTLGLGLSAARRKEGAGEFRDLGAVDAYLRWRPVRGRSYLAVQGELFGRTFRNVDGGSDQGWYAQAAWRQGAYYAFGLRYDDAPTAGDTPTGRERRYGALFGWLPSEFQRLRLQVSYDVRPGGADGLEALIGLEFGIGSHGAHPF